MNCEEEVLASGLFDFVVYPVPESREFEFHGKNQKGLMVILGEETPSELKEFLAKILASVGLDLSEDALMAEVSSGENFSFAKLAEAHGVKYALFFGLRPKKASLNINTPLYHPFKISGISFLFADQLSAIQNDAKLKRPLWEGLKKVFVIRDS